MMTMMMNNLTRILAANNINLSTKLGGYLFLRKISFVARELKLKEFGTIDTSLELENVNLDDRVKQMKSNEVLIKLVASPINPADLNTIQGKYASLPDKLPAVIGNEGLFEVVEAHNNNVKLKRGDWVLPFKLAWGTWRSHAIAAGDELIKIPNTLDYKACATMQVNPCTAFRMLNDFVQLSEHDTVIQNGANSGVGQSVIQLGRIMNVNVVNIVRKRDDAAAQSALCKYLEQLGAKYIFTEDELRRAPLANDLWKRIARPKLALNCVGGKATTDMIRLLDQAATVVTYGGMSRQPLTLNTADFIFKDLRLRGFWMTAWRRQNPNAYEGMLEKIIELIASKQFVSPDCEEYKLDDFKRAFTRAQQPFTNKKILLTS